jgi:hypothetical protein
MGDGAHLNQSVQYSAGGANSVFAESEAFDEALGIHGGPLEVGLHVVAAEFLEPGGRRIVGNTDSNDGNLSKRANSMIDWRIRSDFSSPAMSREVDTSILISWKRQGGQPEQR